MGKTFIIEEANRTLVFVASVVKEIQSIWLALSASKDNHLDQTKLDRLKYCNEELSQVGCFLRDPLQGLVDFPSFYKNQPVFLSWNLGEEQVEHWHSVQEHFQNRHRVDEDFLAWNTQIPMPDLNVA